MKVWVVETGCYSDRRITGIYTNEAEVENIRASFDCSISEWETDKGLEGARQGLTWFRVSIRRDGEVLDVELPSSDYNDPPSETSHYFCDWDSERKKLAMNVDCWARDEQHAIKIASEYLTMTLARGDWDRID